MCVDGGATAEKADVSHRLKLMPGTGGNQHRVSRADFSRFFVHLHERCSLQHEVDFLTKLMVVPLSHTSLWQAGFREALILHWGVGCIENASDG